MVTDRQGFTLQLRCFSKIATNFYQKDSRSFQQWVQQEAKRSYLQDYEGTHTHTDTQTNCYNLPPTLGLINTVTVVLRGSSLIKIGMWAVTLVRHTESSIKSLTVQEYFHFLFLRHIISEIKHM